MIDKNGDVFEFTADHAKDAGGGIFCGSTDLKGNNTLEFEIKGKITRHGDYARLVIQVYSDEADEYAPSVMLDPVPLTGKYSIVKVNLQGEVKKVQKVQFVLVTDNASCNVQIKGMRFVK